MPGFFDAFTVSTGVELLKIAKREGWLRYPIDLVRRKHRVLLLGSTGAGKTQFLKSIPEIVSQPIPQAARTEFSSVGRFEINGALFDLIDTPGQLEHRPRRDEAVKGAIRRRLKGVINFVSYGYHEYGAPIGNVIINSAVKPEYLEEHRKREIELLMEWAPLLSAEWILTVVTKADIWWDRRDEVASHYYHQGPYHKRLMELFPNATAIVRPYSSISHRFYDIIPGAGGFDDSVRSSFRAEVFRVLREAIDKNKRIK
jgi:hypothetical protein